jgi:hypothetical protein
MIAQKLQFNNYYNLLTMFSIFYRQIIFNKITKNYVICKF